MLSDAILLGSRSDASDLTSLKRNGVTHILNMAQQLPLYFHSEFICMKIPLQDSSQVNITDYQNVICMYLSHIENIGGRVLVHCISGVSRSVAAVIMHFIADHKFKLKDIYGYIASCRHQISPNDGFKFQLAMLEINELGYSTVAGPGEKVW
eukprot:CAMPEP_0170081402 /NCGR_PEP_ID=MMETSP0019_2-20121128/17275_1 /TAXON_ID=98059 /ORGANISM="Dinobryon sp., Strain UTEXLB2267" /LENGTH=151 /DNA_ID=CAMNT_0010295807 /DNA_START=428 /DNA_END=880 /DNA_ORIENTATION=-